MAAALVLALGVALVPVSVAAAWGRIALIDTDAFVSALAPLAEDAAVQDLVAERVTGAIVERADLERRVSDVVSGLAALDLPPRARAGLPALEAAAVEGLRGLIERSVAELVASDRFAAVWTLAVRTAHSSATRLLGGDGAGLVETDGGLLRIRLDAIAGEVRDRLGADGWGRAAELPEVSVVVTIGSADTLVAARAIYATAVAAGAWLPWVNLALLAGGMLLARRRLTALARVAGAVALVMIGFAVLIAAGGRAFAGAGGETDAAAAVYDAVTGSLWVACTVTGATAIGVLVGALLVRRGIRAAGAPEE